MVGVGGARAPLDAVGHGSQQAAGHTGGDAAHAAAAGAPAGPLPPHVAVPAGHAGGIDAACGETALRAQGGGREMALGALTDRSSFVYFRSKRREDCWLFLREGMVDVLTLGSYVQAA